MIFKWRRKIFGSFLRLLTFSYMFIWGIIYSSLRARWASSSYLETGLQGSPTPHHRFLPQTPQRNGFGIQDMDRITSPILAECFSGNTFSANGTDSRSSGGGILQFFMTSVLVLHLNHHLEALLFVSSSSSLVCAGEHGSARRTWAWGPGFES